MSDPESTENNLGKATGGITAIADKSGIDYVITIIYDRLKIKS
jgi:hypothetical protein